MFGLRMGRTAVRVAAMPLAAALSFVPAPASAQPWLFVSPQLVVMLGSSARCTGFVYDANGNRVSRTASAGVGTTVTWGSRTFGCFMWSQ